MGSPETMQLRAMTPYLLESIRRPWFIAKGKDIAKKAPHPSMTKNLVLAQRKQP